jgi:predicted CXXCH cytochrome family protein
MQIATEDTVLGNFNDAVFEDSGVTTHFYQKDGSHFIRTEGPEGQEAEYAVAYTFGVEPLQQYLIEFPGGRLQALTVAWDTEAERWYDLYPGERVAPDDPLHWTGRLQTWNTMCAECHSTALIKGYDEESDTFDTTWERLDVGCQACHGPGSIHLDWALSGGGGSDPGLSISLHRGELNEQLNACAPCHSRRATLTEDAAHGGRFLDLYAPSRVQADLYHADGQILEEVYVYGSFLQSLMSQRGVACTDCHDAHGLGLLMQGNAVCTQCHTSEPPLERFPTLPAKNYDSEEHHFHAPGTPGASCVDCHMPTKTYMGIDPRRDHSIRIPNPTLSAELGTPNACNGCHDEQSAQWAVDALARWYGPSDRPANFTERFARAADPDAGSAKELLSLASDPEAPALLRASSLERLSLINLQSYAPISNALTDPSPLVRASALRAMAGAPPEQQAANAAPLLEDDERGVRIEAARLLATLPPESLPKAMRGHQSAALKEYLHAQQLSADTPGAHMNIAILQQEQGAPEKAEASYRRALELDPYFLPAHFNLASLLNALGRNQEAEAVFRDGIEHAPKEGDLHFSLSLLLAEEGRLEEAATSLMVSAELLPERARVHYNLGLTLQHLGRRQEAEVALLRARLIEPNQPDFLHALAIFYLQGEEWVEAQRHAKALVEAVPGSRLPQELVQRAVAGAKGESATGED